MSFSLLRSFCPGVSWNGPNAGPTFDAQVVHASNQAEETFFAPISSPGVPDSPKLDSIFFSKSDDRNVVSQLSVVCCIMKDSALVVFVQCIGDGDSARNGSIFEDLLHHGLFLIGALDGPEGVHLVLVEMWRFRAFFVKSPASFTNFGS